MDDLLWELGAREAVQSSAQALAPESLTQRGCSGGLDGPLCVLFRARLRRWPFSSPGGC